MTRQQIIRRLQVLGCKLDETFGNTLLTYPKERKDLILMATIEGEIGGLIWVLSNESRKKMLALDNHLPHSVKVSAIKKISLELNFLNEDSVPKNNHA